MRVARLRTSLTRLFHEPRNAALDCPLETVAGALIARVEPERGIVGDGEFDGMRRCPLLRQYR